ncbi:MAG: c-type cytochrome [Flavobacterium sp.]|jgi:cytochrome c
MKKISLFIVVFSVLCLESCGKKEEKEDFGPSKSASEVSIENGKNLFEGKGTCVACHKPNTKIIGPSIKDIASIYKEENGNIVEFLKGNEKPIVDPSQYEVMKTNFSITKKMSNDELESIKLYINSFN